jgi:hypothetical protein
MSNGPFHKVTRRALTRKAEELAEEFAILGDPRETGTSFDMDEILRRAQTRKAEELAEEFARHEPGAVKLIRELLAGASTSLEELITKNLCQEDDLDYIERMDHLTAIAEGRRNASLREIDRRRAILGETLRRSVQEIEADEFKVIETRPAQGKNAA